MLRAYGEIHTFASLFLCLVGNKKQPELIYSQNPSFANENNIKLFINGWGHKIMSWTNIHPGSLEFLTLVRSIRVCLWKWIMNCEYVNAQCRLSHMYSRGERKKNCKNPASRKKCGNKKILFFLPHFFPTPRLSFPRGSYLF